MVSSQQKKQNSLWHTSMKFKKTPPLNIIKISLNKNFFSLCNNPPLENNILWIRIINVFSTVCFFHAFLSQKYINWKTYFIKFLKIMLHEFPKIMVQDFLKINVPRFFEIHGPWIFIGELYTLNKKNKCFFNSQES